MNTQLNSAELNALITLMDDPDENVYSHVKSTIKAHGELVIPQLEFWWESHKYGPLFHQRVMELIQSIQYESVYQRLKYWKEDPQNDLLEGILIINRYQYPGYDEMELRKCIQRIRQDIWLELNENLTALEVVKVMNHIIFKVHDFHGDREDYHAPKNSYFTDVLTSKTGNPLSMAMLYVLVAQSLDIPVYGVNLPSHFVCCYIDSFLGEPNQASQINQGDILFYVNPFSDGAILHRNEVEEFVQNAGMTSEDKYFLPCTHNDMMCRMLNNLIYSYSQLRKEEKVRELKTLLSIFVE